MRITTKGQVTIPVEIRERAGLLPNTEVEFAMDGDVVTIKCTKQKDGRDGVDTLRRELQDGPAPAPAPK